MPLPFLPVSLGNTKNKRCRSNGIYLSGEIPFRIIGYGTRNGLIPLPFSYSQQEAKEKAAAKSRKAKREAEKVVILGASYHNEAL